MLCSTRQLTANRAQILNAENVACKSERLQTHCQELETHCIECRCLTSQMAENGQKLDFMAFSSLFSMPKVKRLLDAYPGKQQAPQTSGYVSRWWVISHPPCCYGRMGLTFVDCQRVLPTNTPCCSESRYGVLWERGIWVIARISDRTELCVTYRCWIAHCKRLGDMAFSVCFPWVVWRICISCITCMTSNTRNTSHKAQNAGYWLLIQTFLYSENHSCHSSERETIHLLCHFNTDFWICGTLYGIYSGIKIGIGKGKKYQISISIFPSKIINS